MPLNFDLAGKVYPPIEAVITAEQIAAYAAASEDPDPRYQPGPDQIAPAIFPVVPGFAELMAMVTDPELGIDNPLMIVHGEQRFRYHRPMRPGDRIRITPSLDAVEDKGKHALFIGKSEIVAFDGEPIADLWSTIVVRNAGSGTPREKERTAPPERGAAAGTFARTVALDMPPRYADASGDHNLIHLDDAVAQAVGLPGVINHGLGTLSLVASGLVDVAAGGDVTNLVELGVRFTAMVFPGEDLTTTMWHGPGPDCYLFETVKDDGSVVLSGSLEAVAP